MNEVEAPWKYLSFADDDGWRGAVIIRAHDIADGAIKCHVRGINPGGQVLAFDVADEHLPPAKYRERLLTKAEVQEFWPDSKSIREWEENESLTLIDEHELREQSPHKA